MSRHGVVGAPEIYGYYPDDATARMQPRHAVSYPETVHDYQRLQYRYSLGVGVAAALPAWTVVGMLVAPSLADNFNKIVVGAAALGAGALMGKVALFLEKENMLLIRPIQEREKLTPAEASRALFRRSITAAGLTAALTLSGGYLVHKSETAKSPTPKPHRVALQPAPAASR